MDEPAENEFSLEPRGAALRPGERLRRAREAAGMSLAHVASETRIPQRHLQLIEAGDFARLPARTYAIGFSRSFAKAVGLDEEEIAEEVRAEFARSEPLPSVRANSVEPGDPARVPDSKIIWIASAAVLALLLVGYFGYSALYAPAAELPSLLSDDEPVAAGSSPVAASLSADSGPVVFTALEAGVLVRFYDANGTELMQKTMAIGETYTVPESAQGPLLRTGRPDALKITVGGREVPRIATQRQLVQDVPVTAAALLARKVQAPLEQPSPAPPPSPAATQTTPAVTPAARPASPNPAARPQTSNAGPVESAIDAAIGSAPTD